MRNADSQIVGRFVFDEVPKERTNRAISVAKAARAAPSEFTDAVLGFVGVMVFAAGLWFLMLCGL